MILKRADETSGSWCRFVPCLQCGYEVMVDEEPNYDDERTVVCGRCVAGVAYGLKDDE